MSVKFASWFHESLMFSDHPHRAADASVEAATNQLASLEKTFDGRNTRGFDVHASIFANASMRDTCIAKPPCLAIATSGFEGRIYGCA